jgi:CRISPR-associated protein Cmr4
MTTHLTFVHVLSPLHAGVGQGVGAIDLPIAREQATGLPFLPGSSVKGTLRDACGEQSERVSIFGPERNNAHQHAGQAQFSDQRLLLLPVRSLAGVFAWVTSPYLLQRLQRDAADCGVTLPPVPQPTTDGVCVVTSRSTLRCRVPAGDRVVLEDLDLAPDTAQQPALDAWAHTLGPMIFPAASGEPTPSPWAAMVDARLCLVHDDVLDFLLITATEVRARVSIDENTKTASDGQLWHEELLPAEAVLNGMLLVAEVSKAQKKAADVRKALERLVRRPLQFGGKATVGYGLCRMHIHTHAG